MWIDTWLAALALLLWALIFGLTGFGTVLAVRRSRRARSNTAIAYGLPGISLLKPLKGADEGLEANLESFFRQDYPDYELRFSVADPLDPAVEIVRRLIARNPKVDASLAIGAAEIGTNPKVNNLFESYGSARHEWLLISDSNIRVDPTYLREMAGALAPGVGMVTSVVAGRQGRGIGGGLESVHLNTYCARWMGLTAHFGHPCVVGKSMLFKRKTADRFGGLRILGRYLAEDYMAGEAVRKLGLRVEIADHPVPQYIGDYALKAFWDRHLRWGRIRKAQSPLAFLGEIWLGALPCGLLGAFSASRLFADSGLTPAVFLAAHLLVWAAFDFAMLQRMDPRGLRSPWRMPVAWLLREILSLPLWIHSLLGNTVRWRGKDFTVLPGGVLETSTH